MNFIAYDPLVLATINFIHPLISCRLDYCNSILYNVPRNKIDRLKIIQNQCTVADLLKILPHRYHITPFLKKNTSA